MKKSPERQLEGQLEGNLKGNLKGNWKGNWKKQMKGNLKGSRNIEGDPKFDSDVFLKRHRGRQPEKAT